MAYGEGSSIGLTGATCLTLFTSPDGGQIRIAANWWWVRNRFTVIVVARSDARWC